MVADVEASPSKTVIGFHTLHDANVSVVVEGNVACVLELERLFESRYFCSSPKPSVFRNQWKDALSFVTKLTGIHEFDVAVYSWVVPSHKAILQELVSAKKWVHRDHHWCHASLAFYSSPFSHPLILSYDGGGNDGSFSVFRGHSHRLLFLKSYPLNMGTPYRQLATAMPEITGKTVSDTEAGVYMRFAPLNLAGKLMGYAALGTVCPEWIPILTEYYQSFVNPLQSLYNLGERLGISLEPHSLTDDSLARNLAATSQFVFEQILTHRIRYHLESEQAPCDGICLTGGCALNVNANQRVLEEFDLPVHISPAPSDCGISLGACWLVSPPARNKQYHPIEYLGFPLFDTWVPDLQRRLRKGVTAQDIARLLAQEGAIIGVVRGRQEFGPRALGNRSIICYPDREWLKTHINFLKGREWFRPLCPSITQESVSKFILQDSEKVTDSPFMSFAPKLNKAAKGLFPAISHLDGTARIQTVSRESNEWFHTVLREVSIAAAEKDPQRSGYEVCLNTSFNIKGRPILNTVSAALSVLDDAESLWRGKNGPESSHGHKQHLLDYVLIEDVLFYPKEKKSPSD